MSSYAVELCTKILADEKVWDGTEVWGGADCNQFDEEDDD